MEGFTQKLASAKAMAGAAPRKKDAIFYSTIFLRHVRFLKTTYRLPAFAKAMADKARLPGYFLEFEKLLTAKGAESAKKEQRKGLYTTYLQLLSQPCNRNI